jgi:DNA helicase-2/ATP-dependent DNA helicase PcrA
VADEADQARWVADEVLRQREEGTPLTQQAVLFRTSPPQRRAGTGAGAPRIPFVKFGGLRFLEAAHMKDAVSCCAGRTTCAAGWRAFASRGWPGHRAGRGACSCWMRWTPAPTPAPCCWPGSRRRAPRRLGRRCATPAALLDAARRALAGGDAPAIAWLQAQLPRLYGDDARVRAPTWQQLARLAAGYPAASAS